MSTTRPLPSVRRRPIPGMVSQTPDLPTAVRKGELASTSPDPSVDVAASRSAVENRQRSVDYSVTRLVNFRLPVDVHDRFRALVQEAEKLHPRLRKASLTELVIALLEEGPQTADDVAEAIRRKRLDEHEGR